MFFFLHSCSYSLISIPFNSLGGKSPSDRAGMKAEGYLYAYILLIIMSYMSEEYSTVRVSAATKKRLDELKIHPREPYEDVIKRLIERCKGSS
jgi:hypothetical protein